MRNSQISWVEDHRLRYLATGDHIYSIHRKTRYPLRFIKRGDPQYPLAILGYHQRHIGREIGKLSLKRFEFPSTYGRKDEARHCKLIRQSRHVGCYRVEEPGP